MRFLSGILLVAVAVPAACDGAAPPQGPAHDFAAKVMPADLSVLTGDGWNGSFTYLSFGEPEQELSVPAEMNVVQDGRVLELSLSYPEDPQADGQLDLVISDDGRMINAETLQRRVEDDDELILVTEHDCYDNGRPGLCEMIYRIRPDQFVIRKLVTLDGESEAFQRTRYLFTRELPQGGGRHSD